MRSYLVVVVIVVGRVKLAGAHTLVFGSASSLLGSLNYTLLTCSLYIENDAVYLPGVT